METFPSPATLSRTKGDPIALVENPVSIVIYASLAVILVLGFWLKRRRARYEASIPEVDTATIRTVDEDIAEQLRGS